MIRFSSHETPESGHMRTKRYRLFTLAINIIIPFVLMAGSPDEPLTRILFVFDASQSMADRWQSDTKFNVAVRLLNGILDTLSSRKNLELGLRVYGPKRSPGPDCNDSHLMVPLASGQAAGIKNVLKTLSPGGTTPIAFSLEQTVQDFSACPECRNVVILITDGLEACGGNPCKVSFDLQKKGVFLRPFIVGIGKNLAGRFDCMGKYYDASVEAEYLRALDHIMRFTLKPSTAQIRLNDGMGGQTVTDVLVTLRDRITGKTRYSLIHTLSADGTPDTLSLDPLMVYDVTVHTIPSVTVDSVCLTPGEHTVIPVDAPQGYLRFTGSREDLRCILRLEGTGEAIYVQQTGEEGKYLSNTYDITVLSTPRMDFRRVQILPGRITELNIPEPARISFSPGMPFTGSLMMDLGEELLWICNLRSTTGSEELVLQPGRYRITYRPLEAHKSSETLTIPFVAEEGKMQVIGP